MSVTINDPVDVIRYIILTNLVAPFILDKTGAEFQSTILIKNRWNLPTIRVQAKGQIFIRTYGTTESTQKSGLMHEFEDRTFGITAQIESAARYNAKQGLDAVRRALQKSRKIKNFSDSGVNDTAIKAAYDIILLTNNPDLTQNELGMYQYDQEMSFLEKNKQIDA